MTSSAELVGFEPTRCSGQSAVPYPLAIALIVAGAGFEPANLKLMGLAR